MKQFKLLIVKIGGNIINDSENLIHFLKDFSGIKGNKILVHGGGKIATDIAKSLDIKSQWIDGRRITNREMLNVATMVYGGLINKKIVSQLQANGCNAMGITGADANIIAAKKRNPVPVDYGFVGDIQDINTPVLKSLLEAGITPICAPLTHDRQGTILNTNADTIAAELASALAASYHTELLYCFEKAGILADFEDESSIIPKLSFLQYQSLKMNGTVSKGMIPKLENAFNALRAGVKEVLVGHAADLLAMSKHLKNNGTELCLQ